MVATVTAMPPAITGAPATLTPGQTTTLSDAMTGGKWTSATPALASVDSITGVVTALHYGMADIDYGFGGCGQFVKINIVFPAAVAHIAQTAGISIYPSPTNGTVHINWAAAAGIAAVAICDVTGHKVYTTAIDMSEDHGNRTLDLTSLSDGLYIMNVSSATANYNSKVEIRK
jgi:hypothetical protein